MGKDRFSPSQEDRGHGSRHRGDLDDRTEMSAIALASEALPSGLTRMMKMAAIRRPWCAVSKAAAHASSSAMGTFSSGADILLVSFGRVRKGEIGVLGCRV